MALSTRKPVIHKPSPEKPSRLKRSSQKLLRRSVGKLGWVIVGLAFANIYGFFFLAADSYWAHLLDLNREKNFATAFSGLMLFSCAVLLRQIATTQFDNIPKEAHRREFRFHWQGLAGLFLLMSIDECFLLHERLGKFMHHSLESYGVYTHGIFYYDWLIPGCLFVLVVAIAYARFITHLPRTTKRRVLLAGTLYLTGVIGMEMVSGAYIDAHGLENAVMGQQGMLALLNGLEEVAEMVGAATFIQALLLHLESR